MDVVDAVGCGQQRLHLTHVELVNLGILIIRVRRVDGIVLDAPCRQVLPEFVVGLDIGGFGAHLHGHVADDHPLGDGKVRHRRTGVLDGLVNETVGLESLQEPEDHIFRRRPLRKPPRQFDLDHLGDNEPQCPPDQDHRQVRRAHPGGEGPEGPMGGGMAVRCHQDHPGADQAPFGHHLVAHPRVDVKEVGYSLFGDELPHDPVIVRGLGRRRRRVVVKDEDHFVRVPHPFAAHGLEGLDDLEIKIVDLRQIHGRGDYFSGPDAVFPRGPGQDLLDCVHSFSPY